MRILNKESGEKLKPEEKKNIVKKKVMKTRKKF